MQSTIFFCTDGKKRVREGMGGEEGAGDGNGPREVGDFRRPEITLEVSVDYFCKCS